MVYESQEQHEYLVHLDKIVNEIEKQRLSVFIGAGVSTDSGFVDWKGLMHPLIDRLGINPNVNLSLAAQFYKNRYYRQDISELIYTEFNKPVTSPNPVLCTLCSLPIASYWTTNYDSLIEDTLKSAPISKTVEVIVKKEDFKFHKANCEATVYKMHGDKDSPDEAIITKEDYETYDSKREVFTKALSVELISNTFLFIGFSFYDYNLERILNIVKHTFDEKNQKIHYCFMKSVQRDDFDNDEEYYQNLNYQTLRIEDMRRYGIETILLDDFKQIKLCLEYIHSMLNSKRVFISGSLENNGQEVQKDSNQAKFVQNLAKHLINNGYKIISGFGQNIGNYLLIGACFDKKISELRNLHNIIEIYPIVTKSNNDIINLRTELISNCGSIITLFGKNSEHDKISDSDGVYAEYSIALKNQLSILPIGATGMTSEYIWEKETKNAKEKYYYNKKASDDWCNLNAGPYYENQEKILNSIIDLIKFNCNEKRKNTKIILQEGLRTKTKNLKKIFLSFHYNSSHEYADKIRNCINTTSRYITYEEEPIHKNSSEDDIKKWIMKKLEDTTATILIYDNKIFESKYVKFELEESIKRNNKLIVFTFSDDIESATENLQKYFPEIPTKKTMLFKLEPEHLSNKIIDILDDNA